MHPSPEEGGAHAQALGTLFFTCSLQAQAWAAEAVPGNCRPKVAPGVRDRKVVRNRAPGDTIDHELLMQLVERRVGNRVFHQIDWAVLSELQSWL
jgi:hypothetical protein